MAFIDGNATSCRSPVLTGWPSRAPTTGADDQTQPVAGMYYGLPSYHSQQPEADLTSSSRLDFLYDRPSAVYSPPQQPQQQQQQQQSMPPPAGVARQNSRGGSSSAFVQQNGFARTAYENHDSDVPPPLPSSLPPDCDSSYRPMTSRAMPAPMFQHHQQQPVANGTQPTAPHNGWNGTNSPGTRQVAAMPVDCQQNGSLLSPTQLSPANIDRQMSRLAVSSDRHPPPASGGAAAMTSRFGTGNRDPTSGGNKSTTTRTLPMSYARRLSAPGPCGEMPTTGRNAGARKQWAITPCGFTNSRGAPQQPNGNGRTTPVDGQSWNGQSSPHVTAPRTADGPKLLIPSPAGNGYHRMQQYTPSQDSMGDNGDYQFQNNATVDRSSIRHNLREGEEVGDYEQSSIRYTGKANPSKMFRLLQTATGSDTETDVKLAQAALNRQARRRRPTCEEIDDHSERQLGDSSDDIVDISYVGSKIPSRTFRCLQEVLGSRAPQEARSLGLPPPGVTESLEPDQTTPYCRNVKVIHLRPAMKKHSSMDNILCDGYTDL